MLKIEDRLVIKPGIIEGKVATSPISAVEWGGGLLK